MKTPFLRFLLYIDDIVTESRFRIIMSFRALLTPIIKYKTRFREYLPY